MAGKLSNYPIIILAAGQGTRMGTPKGLIDYNGLPWIVEQLRRSRKAGFARSLVVLGYQHVDYLYRVPDMDHVVNPEPGRGQFSSLQCGLASLDLKSVPGAFVLPVDVPCANRETLEDLAAEKVDVVIPTWKQRGGHPVLLSRAFIEYLLGLPPESRLDEEIHKLSINHVLHIAVEDASVVMNINTADEWKKFIA